MSTKLFGLAGTFLFLTSTLGCSGDGPSDPGVDDADGVAAFSYEGSGFSGDFNAVGRFERDGNGAMIHQSFATGVDVTLPQFGLAYYGIVAAHFYPPELDDLSILLSGQLAGDYPIRGADECSFMIQHGLEPCSAIGFAFQLASNGSFSSATSSFELISGSVTVTSVSKGRVKGTFNGVARQFGDWRTGELYVPGVEVEISGGTFDVPIITLDHWNGSPQLNPNILAPLGSQAGR